MANTTKSSAAEVFWIYIVFTGVWVLIAAWDWYAFYANDLIHARHGFGVYVDLAVAVAASVVMLAYAVTGAIKYFFVRTAETSIKGRNKLL